MADNNTEEGDSMSTNNNVNKPLPPQPERIRHLPEWETPLHPPKRRRDESSSIFSRLPSITMPKPALAIGMPPVLRHPTTFTTRPKEPRKKKAVPISKQSISAPFDFSQGTISPDGSMSMLNKEMLLGSPTGSGTLLPLHNANMRSSQTLTTITTPTTGWSPPSTPNNHHQLIDEKTTNNTKSPLKYLSSLITILGPKKQPSLSSPNTPPEKPHPPNNPPTSKFPHNILNLPRRSLILYIIIPLSTILLLALILGLGLGLGLRSHDNPTATILPLPWNPLPTSGSYAGDLTYYNIGLGACGYNNSDAEYVCAVGHDLFDAAGGAATNPNENGLCGRRIRVWREGDREGDDDGVVVTVVDRCVGCEGTDLDLSPAVFAGFGEEAVWEGRIRGRWVWV